MRARWKLGTLAEIYGEAGTGNLHAEVKIDEIIFLRKIPMRKGIFGQVGHRTAGLFDHIIGSRTAFGHHVAGDVGYIEEDVADVGLGLCESVGEGFLRLLEFGDTCLGLFGKVAFTGLHVGADCGGEAVELGGLGIVLKLEGAPAVIEGEHTVDCVTSLKAFYCKPLDNAVGVGFDLL